MINDKKSFGTAKDGTIFNAESPEVKAEFTPDASAPTLEQAIVLAVNKRNQLIASGKKPATSEELAAEVLKTEAEEAVERNEKAKVIQNLKEVAEAESVKENAEELKGALEDAIEDVTNDEEGTIRTAANKIAVKTVSDAKVAAKAEADAKAIAKGVADAKAAREAKEAKEGK